MDWQAVINLFLYLYLQMSFSEIQAELAIQAYLPSLPNSAKIKYLLNISNLKLKFYSRMP